MINLCILFRVPIRKRNNFMKFYRGRLSMDANKKARNFRGLKIAFYCLGLPLFVASVIIACIPFFNHDPFMANTTNAMFAKYVSVVFGTGMYGVWLAFAAWAIIALITIIVGNTMKSFRAKTVVVVACILIVMLGSVLVCDLMMDKGIKEVEANAPDGVVVNNYKNQLSFYRTVTSSRKTTTRVLESYTDVLTNRVQAFLNIYNVFYYDYIFNEKATNAGNTPIYENYYKLKDAASGDPDKLVTTEPNGAGHLVLNGVDYGEQFYYLEYTNKTIEDGKQVDHKDYVWFDSDYRAAGTKYGKGGPQPANLVDGVYGKSYYNINGLLTDATVPGIDTSIQIIKAYNEAFDYIKANFDDIATEYMFTPTEGDSDEAKVEKLVNHVLRTVGATNRTTYYTTEYGAEKVSTYATMEDMYNWEMAKAAGFSITATELDKVLGALGKGLGTGLGFVVDLLDQLSGIVDVLAMLRDIIPGKTLDLTLTKGTESITIHVKLTDIATSTVEVDQDYVIDENLDADTLQGVLASFGLDAQKIVDLVGGLLGVSVDATQYVGDPHWLQNLVIDLIDTIYWYASPVLLPVFDEEILTLGMNPETDEEQIAYANAIAKYARARYEGKQAGAVKGCALIGSSLGDGSGYYAGSTGFTYLEILQLETDLSYQPLYYPIMAYRDMCVIFAGFAVIFTILYYRACERALDPNYERGKKAKKGKKAEEEEAPVEEAPVIEAPAEEIAQEPADENLTKEEE